MKSILFAGALASCLLGSAAWAESGDPTVGLFVQDAGLSNELELQESKIVLEDSTNPAVRAFAREMMRDHSVAQAELDRAASRAGVPSRMVFDSIRQKQVDDLGLMDSPKLDESYLKDQVEAHARAAAVLSDYAATGTDPALRAYARATLPVVLRHQRMLERLTGSANPL